MRGFGRLDGDEGFAEVFFDGAFLPDDILPGGVVLGAVGEGWSVAMATTSSERDLTLRAPGRFTAQASRGPGPVLGRRRLAPPPGRRRPRPLTHAIMLMVDLRRLRAFRDRT